MDVDVSMANHCRRERASARSNLVRITHNRNLETFLAPASPTSLFITPVSIAKSQLRRFPESDEGNLLGRRGISINTVGL
jgi:hypothetical protein